MDTIAILNQLKQKRDRVTAALAALEETRAGIYGASNGRRTQGKRRLSAAAKKRISLGMKARWAKAKKAGKNRL